MKRKAWVPRGTLSTIQALHGGACVTCSKPIAPGETVLYRSMCVYIAHVPCGYRFEAGNYQ